MLSRGTRVVVGCHGAHTAMIERAEASESRFPEGGHARRHIARVSSAITAPSPSFLGRCEGRVCG